MFLIQACRAHCRSATADDETCQEASGMSAEAILQQEEMLPSSLNRQTDDAPKDAGGPVPLLLEEEVRICPISGLSTLQGACPFAKPKAKAKDGGKKQRAAVKLDFQWEQAESKVTISVRAHPTDAFVALELPDSASQQEIKRQYKALSLRHHPDKNQDDPDATDRFQRIKDAYQALKDTDGELAFPWADYPEKQQVMPGNEAIAIFAEVGREACEEHHFQGLQLRHLVKSSSVQVLKFERELEEGRVTECELQALCTDSAHFVNHLVKVHRRDAWEFQAELDDMRSCMDGQPRDACYMSGAASKGPGLASRRRGAGAAPTSRAAPPLPTLLGSAAGWALDVCSSVRALKSVLEVKESAQSIRCRALVERAGQGLAEARWHPPTSQQLKGYGEAQRVQVTCGGGYFAPRVAEDAFGLPSYMSPEASEESDCAGIGAGLRRDWEGATASFVRDEPVRVLESSTAVAFIGGRSGKSWVKGGVRIRLVAEPEQFPAALGHELKGCRRGLLTFGCCTEARKSSAVSVKVEAAAEELLASLWLSFRFRQIAWRSSAAFEVAMTQRRWIRSGPSQRAVRASTFARVVFERSLQRGTDFLKDVDKNDDGFLDKDELAAMLDAVGMPKERAHALFDAADVDRSGTVDFEEFCTWLFSDVKELMEVCVKQGEIVNKHLKLEMTVGDVLCFGLDEQLVRSQFRYEISVEPTAETVKHLESRSKLYADERKKQQLDALDKGITEAKSKLEAAKAKAAKAKPKDPKDAKADAKAESSAEEAAVLDCERKLQAAEKAKARMEETPPELQEAPFLDKVFDSLVAVDDISAGSSGAHVVKWKAKEEGMATAKVLQYYTVVEGPDDKEVEKVETFDFTVTVVPAGSGAVKADWYAWSWYDVKWIKTPANKADKFAKKMGRAAKELQWVPSVFGPKKEKLHTQLTYCFSPKKVPG
ncbi:dnaJ [Symbiodinium microadriaticum]|nr:dnaJ [Symbiodinium microadriaticum]